MRIGGQDLLEVFFIQHATSLGAMDRIIGQFGPKNIDIVHLGVYCTVLY